MWFYALVFAPPAFDLLSTLFSVTRWGPHVETNPLWRAVLRRFGLVGLVTGYVGVLALLSGVASAYDLLGLIGVIYAPPAINNAIMLVRNLRAEVRADPS